MWNLIDKLGRRYRIELKWIEWSDEAGQHREQFPVKVYEPEPTPGELVYEAKRLLKRFTQEVPYGWHIEEVKDVDVD